MGQLLPSESAAASKRQRCGDPPSQGLMPRLRKWQPLLPPGPPGPPAAAGHASDVVGHPVEEASQNSC